MSRKLSELKIGQSGRVSRVEAADEVGRRILEMGLIPGTEVRLEGAAPLGDPLVFLVRGYRLSLRKSEAVQVAIEES
jgi:Fe2+ transport system protein FeoA